MAHPGGRGTAVAEKETFPLHTSGLNPARGVSQRLNRSEQSCNKMDEVKDLLYFLALYFAFSVPSSDFSIQMCATV
jgi:hypothetical protein